MYVHGVDSCVETAIVAFETPTGWAMQSSRSEVLAAQQTRSVVADVCNSSWCFALLGEGNFSALSGYGCGQEPWAKQVATVYLLCTPQEPYLWSSSSVQHLLLGMLGCGT